MSGKLIVIDGSDGTGKATQAKHLFEKLQKEGHQVDTLDFPRYKQPSAWFVEQYLGGNFGTLDDIKPQTASLFYALDRYAESAHMRRALAAGTHLVLDRYVSANIGHQTAKMSDPDERKRFVAWVEELEYEILDLPKPDLQIILHLDPQIAQVAMQDEGRKLDLHESNMDHLVRSNQTYIEIANNRDDWQLIDCLKENGERLSIDEVAKEIWKLVTPIL